MSRKSSILYVLAAACGVSEEDFEALTARVDASTTEIASLQDDLDATTADLDQLRVDHDALAAELAALTGGVDLTDIESRLTAAESRLDANDDALDALSASVTGVVDRLDGHDLALADQDDALADHEDRVGDLEARQGNLSWYTAGNCACTYASTTPADVPSSSMILTATHGGSFLIGYTASELAYGVSTGNTVDLDTRVHLTRIGGTAFTFDSTAVSTTLIGGSSPMNVISNQVVVQIPGPGTYQLTLQASGRARLNNWDLWAVQLAPPL